MNRKKDIHLIGIGGIGLSAIAKHYLLRGFKVSGSDLIDNAETTAIKDLGADIYIGHDCKNVNAERVIFSSAISNDNPELIFAKSQGMEILERRDALAEIFNSYKNRIAISGMHGKTTTTALISHILSDFSPTCFIGGVSENHNSNYVEGEGELCITEACEYKRNFLSLKPTIGIVLNISLDHTDYYKDIDDVKSAFVDFLKPTLCGGFQVIHDEEEYLINHYRNAVTFGFKGGRFNAKEIVCHEGKYSFTACDGDNGISRVNLPLYGKHNILNALCCFAICSIVNIDYTVIVKAIENFKGIKRRFSEHKCEYTNLFEDYAHHPEEIKSLIETAKQIPHKRLFIVFQPHTYSRTKSLLPYFAEAFDEVDYLYIAQVYSAREELIIGGTSYDLFDIIRKRDKVKNVKHFMNIESLAAEIKSVTTKDDLVIVTGAGDIDKILPLLQCNHPNEVIS